jgi:predicted transcriptional regulator
MSETHEPYNGLPPFVAGSDTSYEAAMSMIDEAGTKRERVRRFFERRGEFGACDFELEAYLGLGPNTARPRRRELELEGAVVRTPARRETPARKWAHVYVLARFAPADEAAS